MNKCVRTPHVGANTDRRLRPFSLLLAVFLTVATIAPAVAGDPGDPGATLGATAADPALADRERVQRDPVAKASNLGDPVPASVIVPGTGGLEWVWASPCALNGCTTGILVGKDGFNFATAAQWALRPPPSAFQDGGANICASPWFDASHNHCDLVNLDNGALGSAPNGGLPAGTTGLAPMVGHWETLLVRTLGGACCSNGPGTETECIVTTQDDCEANHSLYLGDGTKCTGPLAGPEFPAPGGTTFVGAGSGSGDPGGRTFSYSDILVGDFGELFWGPSAADAIRVSLTGAGGLTPLSFDFGASDLPGGFAVWSHDSIAYVNPGPGATGPLRVRLTLTQTSPGTSGWVPAPAEIAFAGAVIDVLSTGPSYAVNILFEAEFPRNSGGWVPVNTLDQDPGDRTQTDFSAGYFHSTPELLDCVTLTVDMESMTAQATSSGVLVSWTTATEIDTIGFRLLRERKAAGGEKAYDVVVPLMPAAGHGLMGATYQYLDDSKAARTAAAYYIEDIDIFGKVTLHGPIAVNRKIQARGVDSRPEGRSKR